MDIYLFSDNIYFSHAYMHSLSKLYKQLTLFNGLLKIKATECARVCFLAC